MNLPSSKIKIRKRTFFPRKTTQNYELCSHKRMPYHPCMGKLTYIWHKFWQNVGKYIIHGWYGIVFSMVGINSTTLFRREVYIYPVFFGDSRSLKVKNDHLQYPYHPCHGYIKTHIWHEYNYGIPWDFPWIPSDYGI